MQSIYRTLHKHVWRDRSGEKADEVKYFPSMSYAIDTYRSFEQSNLILFSDGFITVSPSLRKFTLHTISNVYDKGVRTGYIASILYLRDENVNLIIRDRVSRGDMHYRRRLLLG